jgi:hypothetical protein
MRRALNELIRDLKVASVWPGTDENRARLRPIGNNPTGQLEKALEPDIVYKLVRGYSAQLGLEIGARERRRPPLIGLVTRPTSPRCRNGSAR